MTTSPITCTWNWCAHWLWIARRCWARAILVLCGSVSLAQTADVDRGIASLAQGVIDLEAGRWNQARRNLLDARPHVPELADYIAFFLATVELRAEQYDRVADLLAPLWTRQPASPVLGECAIIAATAALERKQAGEAAGLLERHANGLPQPRGALLTGRAWEAAGNKTRAAEAYQTVFYNHPLAPEAQEAGEALQRLNQPASPQAMLSRATTLMKSGEAARARREFLAMLGILSGAEADTARVRAAASLYLARQHTEAFKALASLQVHSPDAEAERLYYLFSTARRLNRVDATSEALEQLARNHPQSVWRLEALVAEGNRHLLENRRKEYEAAYSACAESFPAAPQAAYCHWKVAWLHWLERRPDAEELLRDHLTRYPASPQANAALYFLARASTERGRREAAKTYLTAIVARFPNTYYGGLARDRLAEPALRQAGESAEVAAFLKRIRFPERNLPPAPPDARSECVERARLLVRSNLYAWAEHELRFGARNGESATLMAMELAETATRRGQPHRGIRFIRGLVPIYLFVPFTAAPPRFWELAFPFPYRDVVERYASQRGLDPFLLAGLIRQESEFDPAAVSAAKAVGLTQVLPGTGRALSRAVGIAGFRTSMLTLPDPNVRIGSYFFRRLLDSLQGSHEFALAAYNAGPSRVAVWKDWGPFREPAEFVETIPFTETREYVQAVLRNARTYRDLYAGHPAAVPSKVTPAPAAQAQKKANAGKRTQVRSGSAGKRKAKVPKRTDRKAH